MDLGLMDCLPEIAKEIATRLRGICSVREDSTSSSLPCIDYAYVHKRLKNVASSEQLLIPLFKPIVFGNTKNNKVQFDFMENELLQLGVPIRMVRLDSEPWGRAVKHGEQLTKEETTKLKDISLQVLSVLDDECDSILHREYTLNGISHFLLYSVLFSRLPTKYIPFVVVSNDHIPGPVGFSLAAKYFEIPRIYLQHASVSKIFPKLDYELSVLGNEVSAEVYNVEPLVISNLQNVIVLPREPFVSSIGALPKLDEGKVVVCLYLSGYSNETVLEAAVRKLEGNPYVSKIHIKPHPNSSYNSHIQSFLESNSHRVIDSHLEIPHVAVVGGSSTVLQLVARNVITFQCFDFDDVPDDYYEFVKNGLVDKVEVAKLSSKFWVEYDNLRKTDNLKKYIPDSSSFIVQTSRLVLKSFVLKQMLRLNMMAKFSKSLGGEFYKLLWNELEICRSLKHNNKYFNLFATTEKALSEDKFVRSSAISLLHQCRVPDIYELVEMAQKSESCAGMAQYYKYFKLRWTNEKIEYTEFIADYEFLHHVEEPKLKRVMANAMISYLFTLKEYKLLSKYFSIQVLSDLKLANVSNLSFLLTAKDTLGEPVKDILDHVFEFLPEFDQIKFKWLLIWNCLSYDKIESWLESSSNYVPVQDTEHIEQIRLMCSDLGYSTDNELLNVYHDIDLSCKKRKIRNLMMARVSEGQCTDFYEIVREHLKKEEPFSFVRVSDGEGYIFDGFTFDLDDSINRELHWWGVNLPIDLRKKVKEALLNSLSNTDALGIPSVFRWRRELNPKITTFNNSIQHRGMMSVLNGVSRLMQNDNRMKLRLVLEEKANQFLFIDAPKLKELVKEAKKLIIVSSVDSRAFNCLSVDGIETQFITIPTHSRTSSVSGYSNQNKPLPFVYTDILTKVESVSVPGALVLISAGVIGKLFIDVAKKKGAVVLDFGECADSYRAFSSGTIGNIVKG